MTSRSKWLLPLALAVSVADTGCKNQNISCKWIDTPIQIDGEVADWIDIPKTYFKQPGASVTAK